MTNGSNESVPAHRLVCIGDSITQGVRSGAATDGAWSWPDIVARALGVGDTFRSPRLGGPGPGMPVNLETLARDVLGRYGSKLDWYELPGAALRTRSWMARVEKYWETGPGTEPPDGPVPQNLGLMGFDLRDALALTASECEQRISEPKNNLIDQVPEHSTLRNARHVLSAVGPDATVFDAAGSLAADGGIETLVVMLGANNALEVASNLELKWSGPDFQDLDGKERAGYTLWRPEHFASEYALVADRIEAIGARHTVLATVPHVTIAPIARGVQGKVEPGSEFFRYYTRPWIDDDDFQQDRDPCINADDARRADAAIDEYNETITDIVDQRRSAGQDWRVFDLSGLLDSMAYRRYLEDETAQDLGFVEYDWPPPFEDPEARPDTRFFRSDGGGRTEGGIFSLDGIHPTITGSALVAFELAKVMSEAGVTFAQPVDLDAAVAADALNSSPPPIVDSILEVLGWFDRFGDNFSAITRPGRK